MSEKKSGKKHNTGVMIASLAIAVVLLTVLAIGAFALQNKADKEAEEAQKSVQIINEENFNIESITLESRKDTYTIVQNGYSNNVLQWKILNQDNSNVEQYKLGLIVSRCAKLTLLRDLGHIDQNNAELMEQYGLNPAAVTITIKFKSGTRTFLLGNAYANGYYFLEKGTSRLYVIPAVAGTYFSQTSNDLRALPGLLVQMGNVNVIRIENQTKPTIQMAYLPILTEEGYAWKMLSPVANNLVASKMSEYVEKLNAFTMKTYVAPKVGNDLSVYGFDKPYARLTLVGYNEDYATQVIVVGNPLEEDPTLRYCATYLVDSKEETPGLEDAMVYAIDESSMDLFTVDAINLMDKQFAMVNIKFVHTIKMNINGTPQTIKIQRTDKLDDDGDPIYDATGEKVKVETFYLEEEDQVIKENSFRAFYAKLIGLNIASMLQPGDPTEFGDEVFSFEILTSISLSDETDATLKISGKFRELDSNYYVLLFNEEDTKDSEVTNLCKVKKRDIDKLLAAYELAKAGTLPGLRD